MDASLRRVHTTYCLSEHLGSASLVRSVPDPRALHCSAFETKILKRTLSVNLGLILLLPDYTQTTFDSDQLEFRLPLMLSFK